MGRLIDVDKFLKRVEKDREHEIYLHSWTADMVLERLDSWYAPTVEAIPKDQYEARLKADMGAMLYKLRSEIINMPKYFPYEDHTRWFIDGDVFGLIDKKINTLKGNDNGLDEKTSD